MMGALLIAALIYQLNLRRYAANAYWLAIVSISIVGTLITDNLTDGLGISLVSSSVVFLIALAITFGFWQAKERSLSIHSITTKSREIFYWFAILFTFALGTAAGDLFAEKLELGYLKVAGIFGALIAIIAICPYRLNLKEVWAFWGIYILTRPLGASLGDLFSQSIDAGGLGVGTVATSIACLAGIALTVRISKADSQV